MQMKLAPCIVHNYAGISLKAGYCRSTAAGNTSYRRLFSLRVGSREVLPHGTAAFFTNSSYLWK